MKYLVGDIGNTLTKISLLNSNYRIIKSSNIETQKLKNNNNLKIFFNKTLKKNLQKKILFSSVVPFIFKNINTYLKKKNFEALEIKKLHIKKIIDIRITNFNQLGSDRIANAIASFYKYKKNCIIIDFGTATTFDIVKSTGEYIGGVIAPGVKLSILNLKKNTSLLPVIELRSKSKNYGKNTKDAINAGFLWGYQGLINNIIKKISNNGKINYKIILTGGYANLFKKYINKKSVVDKDITIKGIIQIYKKLIK